MPRHRDDLRHRCTPQSDDDGERAQEHWVERLEIQNTKVSGVDLKQPEDINLLLQEHAVERSSAGGDQQRESRKGNKPTVNLSCTA